MCFTWTHPRRLTTLAESAVYRYRAIRIGALHRLPSGAAIRPPAAPVAAAPIQLAAHASFGSSLRREPPQRWEVQGEEVIRGKSVIRVRRQTRSDLSTCLNDEFIPIRLAACDDRLLGTGATVGKRR